MVYALCRVCLRDATEAEDAAQQVFVSAYAALLRGTAVRRPGPWLATAARNECRLRLRRRSEAPVALDDATVELLRAPDDAAATLAAAEVRHALARLPRRQREAVVLRDVLGFRTGETAAALGISTPAVESLVFRARRTLRGRMRPAAAVLVVPLALREGVAQALTAPAAAVPARAVGVAVGGGLLVKLGGSPLAVKVAAGAAAVGAAGTAAVEIQRDVAPPQGAARPVAVAVVAPPPSQTRAVPRIHRSRRAPVAAPASASAVALVRRKEPEGSDGRRTTGSARAVPVAVVRVVPHRSSGHGSGSSGPGPGTQSDGGGGTTQAQATPAPEPAPTVTTGDGGSSGPESPSPSSGPGPGAVAAETESETHVDSSGHGGGDTVPVEGASGGAGHDGSGSGSEPEEEHSGSH